MKTMSHSKAEREAWHEGKLRNSTPFTGRKETKATAHLRNLKRGGVSAFTPQWAKRGLLYAALNS